MLHCSIPLVDSVTSYAFGLPYAAHLWRQRELDEGGGILFIRAPRRDAGRHVHMHAQLRRQLAYLIGIAGFGVGGIVRRVEQSQAHRLTVAVTTLERRLGVPFDRHAMDAGKL